MKGRSRVEAESPDSCVSQFEVKLLNIFDSFQGLQMKPGYTTEGSSNPFGKIGLSGHTIAGFIIIEDQSRGALHAHTTIFVLYGPHYVARHIHDKTFHKRYCEILDTITILYMPITMINYVMDFILFFFIY